MDVSEVVTLRGGLTVSLDALLLGWDLEDRGFTMRPIGDRLQVVPPERLTIGDAAAIRQYKADLLRLVQYDAASEAVA